MLCFVFHSVQFLWQIYKENVTSLPSAVSSQEPDSCVVSILQLSVQLWLRVTIYPLSVKKKKTYFKRWPPLFQTSQHHTSQGMTRIAILPKNKIHGCDF